MERPRDRLGRPLSAGADQSEAFPSIPPRDTVLSEVAWAEAQEYVSLGLPFHAHEVFEQRWRSCPPEERDLWRALAQWGAALTHQARGNAKGAVQVADRAMKLLEGCVIRAPIDKDGVMASLKGIGDQLT